MRRRKKGRKKSSRRRDTLELEGMECFCNKYWQGRDPYKRAITEECRCHAGGTGDIRMEVMINRLDVHYSG